MNTLKETSIETIRRLPDQCTPEDMMYPVNFVAQVLEGLKDADAGRVYTSADVLERIDQWEK